MNTEQVVELVEGDPVYPTASAGDAAPAGGVPGERLPGPGSDPRRWRFLPRSITARLVTGVVALVVVVVLATGTGTYFALRSFLYARLDQQVAQVADSNQHVVAGCLGNGVPTCHLNGSSGSTLRSPLVEWLTVLDSPGRVIGGPTVPSRDLMAMPLSHDQRTGLFADPNSVRTLTTTDGMTLRVEGRVVHAAGQSFVVVTGLSTGDVDHTLGRLLQLEVVIGAAAVAVALVATAYGVRFSLRRLRRVTGTAREVAAELSPEGTGLDRRVPVDDRSTEVGQLAESMNTLLAAVGTQFAARLASEQRMRQFLADASHELRTPLTSIRGYAELARMQRAQGAGEEDNLSRIESEGTRMSRMVDDLLTLARGDQGSVPQPEVVEVGELLADAVSNARAAYPRRRIVLADVPPLSVVGDSDQLLRMVLNLVNNAAVHTRQSGGIDVRAFTDGGWVGIQVSDEGPGLPPEEAAQVFERFWRADKARTRARGGTGLGLAIVESIVTSHHGTVRFESSVESGSTVTVWLPGHVPPAAR